MNHSVDELWATALQSSLMWLPERRQWFMIWLAFALTVICFLEPGEVVLWRSGITAYYVNPALIGIGHGHYALGRWLVPITTLLVLWQMQSRRRP